MAARKLQNEIDKTLKKVAEGVEAFDAIYDKMMSTTHQAQKEKLETDLKTQIKKLQRLRDQIKTWIASNEIKDKSALTDNRKLIETQMERFKACEKEIKTKAFSKEGLSAQARLDPHEKLKLEVSHWLSGQVDELARQIESSEAEIESLVGTTKKKSSKAAAAGSNRMAELEELNERRKFHVNRLELILRLIENGGLDPDMVQQIKDDIAYFVESNGEEEFEEDFGIYDELNLDQEEETYGMVNDDVHSSHESQSLADTSDIVTNATPSKPAARDRSASNKHKKDDAPPSQQSSEPDSSAQPSATGGDKSPTSARVAPSTKSTSRKATLESNAPNKQPKVSPAQAAPAPPTPATSSASTAPQPRQAPVVLPPIRYSAAAAAAVAPPSSSSAQSPAVTSPTGGAPPSTADGLPAHPGSVKVLPAQAQPIKSPDAQAPPPASGPSPSLSSTSLVSSMQQQQQLQQQQQQQQAQAHPAGVPPPTASPLQSAAIHQSPDKRDPMLPEPHDQLGQGIPRPTSSNAGGEAQKYPSSLSDLVQSFNNVKTKASQDGDRNSVSRLLEAGYSNVPQPADAEKPRYYVPKQPYPTSSWYPQQPMPALESPSLFAKFDVDTLFYIFYYQVGTYMQYLAAEELKRRAWRFHKQYLTWFQRANEPQAITDEYEQGVYLYFDWETAWSTRKKNSFTFAYKYLEDE